ncbi:MAG: primosomal protein N', partial [Dehalococcoidia bacterium]
LEKSFGRRNATVALGQLVRRRLVQRAWAWQRPSVRPKLVRHVRLAVSPEAASEALDRLSRTRATKRRALLGAIAEAGPEGIAVPELGQRLGPPGPVLSALVDQGLVSTYEVRVTRDPLADRDFPVTRPPKLTPHQDQAWRRIVQALDDSSSDPPVWLLQGVTGSGKTELYLRALEHVVAQGKRGLVLVPEIALTPQTIQRFSGRFPGRVAVLHSHLSPGEQFDEWWRIREGQFDVVVGPRGAVFAPQPDLGLIVLDEEHEWTYKQQEQRPYYHARDVAIKLGELTGATVILGSATPSIESFHRARTGQYRLLELPERIAPTGRDGTQAVAGKLPTVLVVDMREELKRGNRSIFSDALRTGIDEALAASEQIILFLNRRGSATFVLCRDCGYVARCRRCDSTLTYHGDEVNLRCHQCNYHIRPPRNCPECWGRRIRYLGLGTQRLEVEVAQNFPSAAILRWDRDVTQGRDAHETILKQFQEHQADILIGTQMLAKGLHLPLVTLVGVVNADIGLHLPDFRAPERVFQVLCQVAGRSGRGAAGGRVIIQTYSPESYAIEAAATQDYVAFYEQEIARRMERGLPPFTRLTRLVYQHTNALSTRRECERVYRLLMERLQTWGFPSTKVVGPAPAPYERLRGRFRWHLIIEGPEPNQLLEELILPEGWTIDVDPVQLL